MLLQLDTKARRGVAEGLSRLALLVGAYPIATSLSLSVANLTIASSSSSINRASSCSMLLLCLSLAWRSAVESRPLFEIHISTRPQVRQLLSDSLDKFDSFSTAVFGSNALADVFSSFLHDPVSSSRCEGLRDVAGCE